MMTMTTLTLSLNTRTQMTQAALQRLSRYVYDDDTFVISAEGYALFAGECVFDSSAQEIKSETLKVASGLIYAYSQSYGETYGSENSLSLLEWSEDWEYWDSSEITFTFSFEEEKEFCVISDPLGYFGDDDVFERQ